MGEIGYLRYALPRFWSFLSTSAAAFCAVMSGYPLQGVRIEVVELNETAERVPFVRLCGYPVQSRPLGKTQQPVEACAA
ncbi:MAG: hypothetical protein WCD57_06330 [Acidobacteriaceae bacterium]